MDKKDRSKETEKSAGAGMQRKEETGDTGKRSPVIKESGIPVLKQRKKSQRKDRKSERNECQGWR